MTEYNLSNVEKYLVKGLAGLLNVDTGWLYSQQVATKLLKGDAVYMGVQLDTSTRKVRGKISRQMISLIKFYDLQWFEDSETKETTLTLSKEFIEVLSGIDPIGSIQKVREKIQSYIHGKQFNNRVQNFNNIIHVLSNHLPDGYTVGQNATNDLVIENRHDGLFSNLEEVISVVEDGDGLLGSVDCMILLSGYYDDDEFKINHVLELQNLMRGNIDITLSHCYYKVYDVDVMEKLFVHGEED